MASTVVILQTDNRPNLDYLLVTQEVNKRVCNYLGYKYRFIEMKNDEYSDIHPATKKIYVVNDFLQKSNDDILIFLDSDAWVQNMFYLNTLIKILMNDKNKH